MRVRLVGGRFLWDNGGGGWKEIRAPAAFSTIRRLPFWPVCSTLSNRCILAGLNTPHLSRANALAWGGWRGSLLELPLARGRGKERRCWGGATTRRSSMRMCTLGFLPLAPQQYKHAGPTSVSSLCPESQTAATSATESKEASAGSATKASFFLQPAAAAASFPDPQSSDCCLLHHAANVDDNALCAQACLCRLFGLPSLSRLTCMFIDVQRLTCLSLCSRSPLRAAD